MRIPRLFAFLAFGIAVLTVLFHLIAAEPGYELARPVTVNVAGQYMQLPAGQAVTILGSPTPNASGEILIRIVLPNGSLSMASVPATSIRRKLALPPPVATPPPAPTPAPAVTPLPSATPAPEANTLPQATSTPSVAAPTPETAPAAAVAPSPTPTPAPPPAQAAVPASSNPGVLDFGPNVYIFDPTMPNIQAQIDPIADQQKTSEFGYNRYAFLFKPGNYNLNVRLGYYMQVVGLGQSPNGVSIKGAVQCNDKGNVTKTFWRCIENLSVNPTDDKGTSLWAVSQGTALRRLHIKGSLSLFSGGWSSGGFLADCEIDGKVIPGSQQQWLSRNSVWGSWNGGVWNMVFVGDKNPPGKGWPPDTVVSKTPLIAEKPYLYIDASDHYFVMVPSWRTDSQGTSWSAGPTPGTSIPIGQFYLAHAGKDTAASINAALNLGKNLILTPGIYHLEDSIKVTRPDTVVLGLGYATLIPDRGTPAIKVADVSGVKVGGLLLQAGPVNASALLEVGPPGSKASHATDPICIYDIFGRVGGDGPASVDSMITINSSDVVGDNTWLWRADHPRGEVGWTLNKNKNGLVVNGNNVTYYGLAVEHTQEYQTLWNGNGGRVFFYQSEMPYDVPGQDVWQHGSVKGYASYKVGDSVTTHEAWGVGIYCLFLAAPVISDNAIETPVSAGIKMHHLTDIHLAGGGGISHVINGTGPASMGKGRATIE